MSHPTGGKSVRYGHRIPGRYAQTWVLSQRSKDQYTFGAALNRLTNDPCQPSRHNYFHKDCELEEMERSEV